MTNEKANPNPTRAAVFLLVACIAVACAASADEAATAARTKAASQRAAAQSTAGAQTKINAQQLAVVDRALEFCGPIDPDSAKKLKEQVAALVKGASPDDVVLARGSETYKSAYSTMDGFIGQIDPRNAKVACANTAHSK
jgi:hypothetical protein